MFVKSSDSEFQVTLIIDTDAVAVGKALKDVLLFSLLLSERCL